MPQKWGTSKNRPHPGGVPIPLSQDEHRAAFDPVLERKHDLRRLCKPLRAFPRDDAEVPDTFRIIRTRVERYVRIALRLGRRDDGRDIILEHFPAEQPLWYILLLPLLFLFI